ncbi:MAG: GNAT family N-acetyltransferase [Rhodospirillaceae bacterium]
MLGISDLAVLAAIDRSEHVDVQYGVENGRLVERPVAMAEVPPWDPVGDGPHSVADKVAFCRRCLVAGAEFLGAFEGDELLGAAVVDGRFEPGLAWLAFLHVSRPHRRRGVASALWDAAISIAKEAGARSMYVSATPTGSAVGFYLARGCRLADPVHPGLFAEEPDDIHLVVALGG